MLKKDSSFVEASLVLLVIFATLAYFVIFVQMSALIAILIVLMVLTGYVYWKDRSFDAIHKGMVEGIRPGIIPIVIFILVGGFCCKVSKRSLVFQDDSYLSRDS